MPDIDEDLTFIDEFCGAGGASQGLSEAGFTPVLAINHWDRAVETHSANFPSVEHWCEDTSKLDMRRLPNARVLWASPICTEVSPAGGRKRRSKQTPGQMELEEHGHVPKAGYVRTRTTFYDVLRAVEVRRFDAVLIENVVEVVDVWELFDWWVEAMKQLGYNVQFVSVSSAHVGDGINPRAPQWRDRLYLVFTRHGIPLPDVDPRPLAWCSACGADTHALQSWKKPGRRIGKYGSQYTYVCERSACRHARVEPYVLPAAAAIDWTNLGTRIGDRPRRKDGLPLAANTLARIEAGLRMFAQPAVVRACGTDPADSTHLRVWPASERPLGTRLTSNSDGLMCPPIMLATNHDGPDGRAYPADGDALPTRTVRIGDGMTALPFTVPAGGTWRTAPASLVDPMGARTTSETDGLVVPPLLVEHRRNGEARPAGAEPTSTITCGDMRGGSHHSVVVPPGAFYVKQFTARGNPGQMSKDVLTAPLGAVTGVDHHSLVIPYRRGSKAYPAGTAALSTVTTHETHAIANGQLDLDVMDCLFRMLQPREHLTAQRFPTSYIVHGNVGEQTMQAGNAVSANVAHWLGRRVAAALGSAA